MSNRSRSQKHHVVLEFKEASRDLLRDIRRLRQELHENEKSLKHKTIGLISEAQEQGCHYEAHIMDYIHGLDILRENYDVKITTLGKRITDSISEAKKTLPSRKAKSYRRDIWLEFASALEPLSGRPSKKVAGLLLDSHDNLLAWDLNHLCHGVTPSAALYVKGSDGGRGHHLWCAERNLIAQYLGLAAIVPNNTDIKIIHKAIDKFTHSLIDAAIADIKLKSCTLVSSHYPCGHCADVIAPMHDGGRLATLKEIIAAWNMGIEESLTDPNRKTKASAKKFGVSKPKIVIHRKVI